MLKKQNFNVFKNSFCGALDKCELCKFFIQVCPIQTSIQLHFCHENKKKKSFSGRKTIIYINCFVNMGGIVRKQQNSMTD